VSTLKVCKFYRRPRSPDGLPQTQTSSVSPVASHGSSRSPAAKLLHRCPPPGPSANRVMHCIPTAAQSEVQLSEASKSRQYTAQVHVPTVVVSHSSSQITSSGPRKGVIVEHPDTGPGVGVAVVGSAVVGASLGEAVLV